jgi:hypothetical protein
MRANSSGVHCVSPAPCFARRWIRQLACWTHGLASQLGVGADQCQCASTPHLASCRAIACLRCASERKGRAWPARLGRSRANAHTGRRTIGRRSARGGVQLGEGQRHGAVQGSWRKGGMACSSAVRCRCGGNPHLVVGLPHDPGSAAAHDAARPPSRRQCMPMLSILGRSRPLGRLRRTGHQSCRAGR